MYSISRLKWKRLRIVLQRGDAVDVSLPADVAADTFSFISSAMPELATDGVNFLAFGLELPVGEYV